MNVEDLIYIVHDAFSDALCDHVIEYHTSMVEQGIATAGQTAFMLESKQIPKVSIDCRYAMAGTNCDQDIF